MEEETMALVKTSYLFAASMDVEPDKEKLFNEVYDTEHIPYLSEVPGVLAIARFKAPCPVHEYRPTRLEQAIDSHGCGFRRLGRYVHHPIPVCFYPDACAVAVVADRTTRDGRCCRGAGRLQLRAGPG
mgnify:CR=1 FL=1